MEQFSEFQGHPPRLPRYCLVKPAPPDSPQIFGWPAPSVNRLRYCMEWLFRPVGTGSFLCFFGEVAPVRSRGGPGRGFGRPFGVQWVARGVSRKPFWRQWMAKVVSRRLFWRQWVGKVVILVALGACSCHEGRVEKPGTFSGNNNVVNGREKIGETRRERYGYKKREKVRKGEMLVLVGYVMLCYVSRWFCWPCWSC